MRKSLVLLALLALAACDRAVFSPWEPIPDLGLTSVQEVMRWVAGEIIYMPDRERMREEYWQSPQETYCWRTGDCEDSCILAMYLIHRDIGLVGQLVLGRYRNGSHGWVYVDGHQWEPQLARIVDDDPDYIIRKSITYCETVWRSRVTHRGLSGPE